MIRDPERIERMARKLVYLWNHMPGMRLGQMVAYAASSGGWEEADTFYVEDDVIERGLDAAIAAKEAAQ